MVVETTKDGSKVTVGIISGNTRETPIEPRWQTPYGQGGERGRIAYGPQQQGGGAQTTHYRPPYVSHLDHPAQRRNDLRELGERLSKAILELKNDRVNLKQEFRQELAAMRQEPKTTLKTIDDDEVEEFACLGKEGSTLISKGFPIKNDDPRAFIVVCSVKDMEFYNDLAYLGASVNLMPSCVFERLNLPYLSPT